MVGSLVFGFEFRSRRREGVSTGVVFITFLYWREIFDCRREVEGG